MKNIFIIIIVVMFALLLGNLMFLSLPDSIGLSEKAMILSLFLFIIGIVGIVRALKG